MSDNLRWFKVWTSITDDPDFLEMDLEDIGRWVLLGAYIGKHGEKGKLRFSEKALCQLLRCTDLNVTIDKIHNVQKQQDISNGKEIVTFKNWYKYQVDSSAERVAKMRQNVTIQEENKKRGDKEENKKRKETTKKEYSPIDFISKLKENPAYQHIEIDHELSRMDAWLLLPKNKGRKKTYTFILNWLNKIERPLEQLLETTHREQTTLDKIRAREKELGR